MCRTNLTYKPAHEREPLLFLDKDLNEVSIAIIFLILGSFFTNRFIYYNADNIVMLTLYFLIAA